MKFIGIDIGSSFIKGAVLDTERLTIEHLSRQPFPDPLTGLPPKHFEIDPQAILDAVQQVLIDLSRQAPDCQGILLCAQMGGVILTDAEGNPVGNYLSWRDQRTTDPCPRGNGSWLDAARQRISDDDLADLGNELRAGSATSLLFWLSENGRLPAGLIPHSVGDFVIRKLCGSPPVMEYTQALGTLNLRTAGWHAEVFRKLGLGDLQWPELREMWQPVGTWQHGSRQIPCHPVIGDHQCALAGAMLADGELSVNVSTGSQTSLLTPTVQLGDYQTRPYLDGRFLNTVTHLPAGRSLDVLVNLLTELPAALGTPLDNPWPTINRLTQQAPETDLTANLSFFAGPMGNTGDISHITTENLTVGTLFRAAFQNMATNYATCASRLSPDHAWNRVVFSGGLVQKIDVLRQSILARIPGEARLCDHTEDTLFGLLVLSLVVGGRAGNLAEAGRIVQRK